MVAVAWPTTKFGVPALWIVNFNYGTFDEFDKYGERAEGTFTANDMAIAFSYANRLTKRVSYRSI